MDIIYEDNHLLIIEKHPGEDAQDELVKRAKAYVGEKYHKPGAVYIGLCHRLDKPVGGVVCLARTSKAAARLSAQFASGLANRRYVCVVCGCVEQRLELCDYLIKDDSRTARIVTAQTAYAKMAKLTATPIARSDDTTLLDVELHTGRFHQIRAQLSHAGYPILFDARYGRGVPGSDIALWGYALSVEHPTLKTCMSFVCPAKGAGFVGYEQMLNAVYGGVQ